MQSPLIISLVILWLFVIGLSLVVLALSRQIGILHERIAPAGALMISGGPKVGEASPKLNVSTLSGQELAIGTANTEGNSQLLFFLSPTCPVCKTLLPVLKSSQRAEKDWLSIVLASDGEIAEQQRFVEHEGLGAFPYILSSDLGLTFQVGKLPYAVLIDRDGIIRSKGLVNSREHIESLFEAKERGVASVQEYISNANPS